MDFPSMIHVKGERTNLFQSLLFPQFNAPTILPQVTIDNGVPNFRHPESITVPNQSQLRTRFIPDHHNQICSHFSSGFDGEANQSLPIVVHEDLHFGFAVSDTQAQKSLPSREETWAGSIWNHVSLYPSSHRRPLRLQINPQTEAHVQGGL